MLSCITLRLPAVLICLLLFACSDATENQTVYDLLIRNGMVFDGTGSAAMTADIAIQGDRIAVIGDLKDAAAVHVIDANGMAVAPGFINMLSWATESLLEDGRSQSDIRQGITLEVFGEGKSMGPLNDQMREQALASQGNIQFDIPWTTLGEYLQHLEKRGISTNVASFIGATTVRIHEIGYADRPATEQELTRMQNLVRQAMREGALGVGSSLIYAPAFYADTNELIALTQAAAEFDGSYISHIRSESNQLLPAVDELISIARASGAGAEIYHLKAAGENNWDKLNDVIKRIELARSEGLDIRANMYTYTAGSTGFDAAMPPWVQEGGNNAWINRLKEPNIRSKVLEQMRTPSDDWENLYLAAGGPENVLLVGFNSQNLKPLIGETLAEIANNRGTSPEDTIIDLTIEDNGNISVVYFLMSEDNIKLKIQQPWMSFGSDGGSYTNAGIFLNSSTHPRAYGNFSRLLGKYVRDQQVIPLAEAIRRLTSQSANHLKIRDRGKLQPGYYADIVIFDPDTISDNATFADPHQYSTGMQHVIVNGELVLQDGQHTDALPGRVVRGPGWSGQQ